MERYQTIGVAAVLVMWCLSFIAAAREFTISQDGDWQKAEITDPFDGNGLIWSLPASKYFFGDEGDDDKAPELSILHRLQGNSVLISFGDSVVFCEGEARRARVIFDHAPPREISNVITGHHHAYIAAYSEIDFSPDEVPSVMSTDFTRQNKRDYVQLIKKLKQSNRVIFRITGPCGHRATVHLDLSPPKPFDVYMNINNSDVVRTEHGEWIRGETDDPSIGRVVIWYLDAESYKADPFLDIEKKPRLIYWETPKHGLYVSFREQVLFCTGKLPKAWLSYDGGRGVNINVPAVFYDGVSLAQTTPALGEKARRQGLRQQAKLLTGIKKHYKVTYNFKGWCGETAMAVFDVSQPLPFKIE